MRVAVVGAGTIARQHLGALATVPQVDEILVCDRSPVTARAMADRFGLMQWSDDFSHALLDFSPDVVHVATPPSSHVQLSRQALEAGCHVIVEKPATSTPAELDDLLALARTRGVVLMENYNYRFNPTTLRLFADLEQGRFGRLLHVDVAMSLDIFSPGSPFLDPALNRSFRDLRIGPVADFVTHLTSLALALVGPHRDVRAIWVESVAPHPFAFDGFRAVLDGEHATATLGFSGTAQPDLFTVGVEGTRGRARVNLFEGRATHEWDRAVAAPLVHLTNGVATGLETVGGSVRSFGRKFSGGPGAYTGLWTLIRRFYHSLDAGSPPPVSTQEMADVARLVADLTDQAVQR